VSAWYSSSRCRLTSAGAFVRRLLPGGVAPMDPDRAAAQDQLALRHLIALQMQAVVLGPEQVGRCGGGLATGLPTRPGLPTGP